MEEGAGATTWNDRDRRSCGAYPRRPATAKGGRLIVPYHVYTKNGAGAFGVIVETAREAIAKAAQFADDGHPEVVFKDLLGNILSHSAVNALAESE